MWWSEGGDRAIERGERIEGRRGEAAKPGFCSQLKVSFLSRQACRETGERNLFQSDVTNSHRQSGDMGASYNKQVLQAALRTNHILKHLPLEILSTIHSLQLSPNRGTFSSRLQPFSGLKCLIKQQNKVIIRHCCKVKEDFFSWDETR